MTLTPLPDALSMRGGSVDMVGRELIEQITLSITNHPRSLQTRIGPSEIGTPCRRKLAYKLLGFPERESTPNWKATVGTAIHAYLEGVFRANNEVWMKGTGHERWIIEEKVGVGTVNGEDIDGNCDVYDRVMAGVIDWKTVGPTQLKKYKSKGPGDQYRVQANLYGRGFVRQGLPVDWVMIVFLPRNGELRDAVIWWEPYDEQIALDALQVLEGIATTTKALGNGSLPLFPAVDNYCAIGCPYFKAGSTDLEQGCPGFPKAPPAALGTNPFA